MKRRPVHLCAFKGCRELIGERAHVCRSHWRDLPVLLQRALTGSRGAEREAARRQVDEWIKTRQPVAPKAPAVPAFHEPKESET